MPDQPPDPAEQPSTTLLRRFREAEQTLQAICHGEVDSVVVRNGHGHQLYALRPVDILYRVFFEELPHGAATLGPDGTILYCNPRLGVMLNTPIEQLTGANWTTFVADRDRGRAASILQLTVGQRHEAELTLLAGGGAQVPVSAAASRFCAEQSLLTCLILTDLTERNRAEAAARLLAAVVASTDDAILTKTCDGVITSWNHGAERLFGYAAEEAIGRPIDFLMPADRKAEADELLARVRAREVVHHHESVRVRKDGRRVDVSVTLSPLYDPGGAVIGASSIARDMSERRRFEADLQQAKEDLTAVNEELRINIEELTAAQKLVEEQQQVYQDLFISAPSCYLLTDPLGVIQCVNAGAEQMFQQRPVRLVGKPLAGFVAQPDHAAYYARLADLKNGTADRIQDWEVTVRVGPAKAETFPASVSVTALRGPDRRLIGLRWLLADISERRRAEAELRASEARFRALVTATAQIVWTADPAGQVIEDSPSWRAFTGQTFDEWCGGGWLNAVHPDDRERVRDVWSTAVARRSLYEVEYRIRGQNGEYRDFLVRAVPVLEADGAVREWTGACTDITERKRREAELRKIEWLLSGVTPSVSERAEYEQPYGDLVQLNTSRLLADSVGTETLKNLTHNTMDVLKTSAAVYEKNGDYALGIFSSGWCRFMDQASRNLCGTDDNRAALAGGKWACHESCWDTSRQSIETGRPVDVECKGGIRLYAVPIRRGAEIVGSMNFGYGDPPTDPQKLAELADRYRVSVAELRKAAAEYESRPAYLVNLAKERLEMSAALVGAVLEANQAKAETDALNRGLESRVQERTAELAAANKELESFSYSVSHDLRAPLRVIDGFSRILVEEHGPSLPPAAVELLGEVRSGAQKMGRLIDDLLAFSRMGRQALSAQAVQPADLVAEVRGLLQPVLAGRNVEWAVGPLPPCWADRNLLRQVFLNLLDNAIKYTRPRDPARIEVGAHPGDRPGEVVYFVKDNGVGFDMQYAGKLFGVFQRLHGVAEFEGTGVGLALAQRILHRHGGRIWAEAAVGRGATFSFSLPARGAT